MTIADAVKAAPLRFGAIGASVAAVQVALRNDGREIQADGEFGRITLTAVKAFQASHGLAVTGAVDGGTAAALDRVGQGPSVLEATPWLATMRAITGTKEEPGARDNPFIIEMAHEVVWRFPELRGNVGWYNHDSVPWCGLGMAYCMAVNGIRPPDAPLSALAWADWGQHLLEPAPGAVMVYSRDGGGHVTLYESEDSNYYYCRGGNQSDSVNVSRIPKSRPLRAVRWPPGRPLPRGGRKFGVTGNAAAVAGREA